MNLPTIPSALLDLAITDVRTIFSQPGIKYVPYVWVSPSMSAEEDICGACAAGAVMLRSLHMSPKKEWHAPHLVFHYKKQAAIIDALEAIDLIREQEVKRALQRLQPHLPEGMLTPEKEHAIKQDYPPEAPENYQPLGRDVDALVRWFEIVRDWFRSHGL